jgi:elongation factor P
MVKAKVRNLLNGAVQDKTFKTSEKFNVPDVEKVPAVFQYRMENAYHFMDNTSYEEFSLTAEKLGEQKLYLKENQEMLALKLNGSVVSLELPVYVELAITETDPSVKGASISGRSTKKAKLETGLEVQAPLYAEIGTVLRVNTETGEASGRA